MSFAKCHNYSGCLIAYRGEEIQVAPGAPMVCPECGHTLTTVPPATSKLWAYVPWAVLALVLGAGFVVARPYLSQIISRLHTTVATPAPESDGGEGPATPAPVPQKTGGTQMNQPGPTPAEPPGNVSRPDRIDTSLTKAENKRARDEVLKRIDLMPTISESNKDRLYNAVERARGMGLILTIPFASGKTTLGNPEIQQLKTELEKPEMRKLRDDPTAVFVILGYADPKGDEKKNLEISQKRADAVLEVMRDRCGVINVMHSVAMGGQKLLDAKNLEKNRVVELWIAQP
jgi:outer membrane protein OmpA-like peptidoglycan-associated protein